MNAGLVCFGVIALFTLVLMVVSSTEKGRKWMLGDR